MTLTPREADVLRALGVLAAEQGFIPTIREIAGAVGLKSTSTVHFHLRSLRDKGYITWTKGQNRAIRVLKEV